ncbi:MAG: sigma-70 family RNA polymerase sigma factor [Chloroflexi bacterium]|nr:sigma-70 family RNA polymerase sigma factor [Chloroflexota bacterium]
MAEATDQDLLTQAQQGNHVAFGQLVSRYQTAVFNSAYRILGRRQDAEDAAQEAFLRAYRAIDRFDVKRPFAPWIKRITLNLCLNHLALAQTKTQVVATDLARPEDNEAPDMDQWTHQTPTPEQTMEKQERHKQLRAGILALPPNYRAVLELRHFQELSYEEMAKVLERPLSSIKSDLFRARKLLAQTLKSKI